MKTKTYTPSISRYSFKFEPEDPQYEYCLWAEISLDNDTYTMTVQSDNGSYAYSWKPTPDGESFKHLMARLDRTYLLRKISCEYFCFEQSKPALIAYAKRNGATPEMLADLQEIERCSEESFLLRANSILGWGYECIPVKREYPAGAEAFSRVFTQVFQPILRKELSQSKGA